MNASLSEDEEEGEEQATAATITGRGATRRLAQWSAGTRREFSRKLSRRWDDNGNPIEAVHLRRVMGLFGILIGKLQLTGPPVLSFDRGRVSNTTWLVSRGDTGFFSIRLFFLKSCCFLSRSIEAIVPIRLYFYLTFLPPSPIFRRRLTTSSSKDKNLTIPSSPVEKLARSDPAYHLSGSN